MKDLEGGKKKPLKAPKKEVVQKTEEDLAAERLRKDKQKQVEEARKQLLKKK
jgi:hypothetical protein